MGSINTVITAKMQDFESLALAAKQIGALMEREPLFLCIGTDKVVEDCLGPLCGDAISLLTRFPVYGALKRPVHRENLAFSIDAAKVLHPQKSIWAIDAGICDFAEPGQIIISNSPVLAAGSILCGDFSIVGVTSPATKTGHMHGSGLGLVSALAGSIAMMVAMALDERAKLVKSAKSFARNS
ncbi:MAG: spore protease YyaC [Eubacteriaceae bacterium]|nr:spore protease YyaC [Eubacteriaceae bacterium]